MTTYRGSGAVGKSVTLQAEGWEFESQSQQT